MSDQMYDRLKWIAQIALPALGTLYWALSDIWGLPCAEQVMGTVMALDVFLGALLGISTAQYYRVRKEKEEVYGSVLRDVRLKGVEQRDEGRTGPCGGGAGDRIP